MITQIDKFGIIQKAQTYILGIITCNSNPIKETSMETHWLAWFSSCSLLVLSLASSFCSSLSMIAWSSWSFSRSCCWLRSRCFHCNTYSHMTRLINNETVINHVIVAAVILILARTKPSKASTTKMANTECTTTTHSNGATNTTLLCMWICLSGINSSYLETECV